VYEEREGNRFPQVELARDRYQAPFKQHTDIKLEIEREPRREAERPRREAEIDITEREYRRRTDPRYDIEYERRAPRENIHIEAETTVDAPTKSKMGYYDDSDTVAIPTHHIRNGDLLILQGRPCQVIRITTSAQTGQHRYLGVDLFTKQLHEESSSISRPSPSVVVQTMYGPLFKQYRVLDIRDDGRVVAITETGDVKQGLSILDQGGLSSRLKEAFADGRGSVRVLVISDGGRELAVDYKVIHGSRL
jgi:hypothetical protein